MTSKLVAFGPTAKAGTRRDRVTELEARVTELEAQLADASRLLKYHQFWMSGDEPYKFAYAIGAFELHKIWRAGQVHNGRKSIPVSYWDLPFDEQLVYIVGVQKAIEAYVGQIKLGVQMGLHNE